MTTSDKIRKDIQKIAKRHLSGDTLDVIAKDYNCARSLIIRIMQQELPEDFWAEKARRRARINKLKEKGELPRKETKKKKRAVASKK